ncbi:HAD family phosphatase [Paracoccus caeni]|uniref:HAD family phosphatase n=1 Tax=Paracoccus caeni TaxID=657651 RepID=A0A934VVC3_9RHOB|nr:HAD family phosphatase [Paracoccus caeni]MBK4216781.1 HAD family phosphatase [Paracoccus caeni]
MTPMPKALIFDCDGTLALTGDMHFAAFAAAFAAQGGVLDNDWYHARGGLARQQLVEQWMEATGQVVELQRVVDDSIALAQTMTDSASPNPPVAELAEIWGKRPSAVASNGEAPVVLATLRSCGLDHLFDTVVTLSDSGVPKPDPTMFLMAAQRLGTAPADCLVLEDSEQGLEAARCAAMPALDVRLPETLTIIAGMTAELRQALLVPAETPKS